MQEIRAVQLVNRADCCQDRLVGARIVVSQTTDYEAYNEARPFDTMSCGSVDEAESPIDEQEVIIKACEPGMTQYDISCCCSTLTDCCWLQPIDQQTDRLAGFN